MQPTLMVAEEFHSIQGEGVWAGTPMHFIRLAGCNVGRKPIPYTGDEQFPILKTGRVAYKCATYDNREFWCDTDFQTGVVMACDMLLDTTWEKHVCISGGEPLLHKDRLAQFIDDAADRGIQIHIESSGTIDIEGWLSDFWLTISPKRDFLPGIIPFADEIKLLIDPGFELTKVPDEINEHPTVFVQPVNDEMHVNLDNLKRCMEVLRVRPSWRLSVQLHKCFGWR